VVYGPVMARRPGLARSNADFPLLATSSVSGLLGELAHVRQARSRCLWRCPRVAVIPLSRPPHRARGGHGPLRPELAAPLGVCPLSQLTQGVGGSSCLLLSGGVAVLCCCTAHASSAHVPGGALPRRPSAFQAGHISSWHESCECYRSSLVAAACRWLLLSAAIRKAARGA
jgi:hypothetical protein